MGLIINDRAELARICDELRAQGKRIVTTNGVFDLIHVGHIRYLQFCKEQGDVLIVGVNTDSSVKQYKGDKRPIVGETDRAELIAALSCVDLAHIFSERTPEAWLDAVKPAAHVKAGDYTLDRSKETPKNKIWEREIVEKHGGQCILAPLVDGKSTTSIIQRIQEAYGQESSNHNANPDRAESSRKSPIDGPKTPAVFLDRDGTIVKDKEFRTNLEELEFIPGALEAMKRLASEAADHKIIIVTNQSGLARGKFTQAEYDRFTAKLVDGIAKNGGRVDGVYHCPHHVSSKDPALARNCGCRKPKAGMLIAAARDHNIDLERSFVIGDKTMDVLLGNNVGARSILVKTGKAGADGEFDAKADFTAPTILEAVEHILGKER